MSRTLNPKQVNCLKKAFIACSGEGQVTINLTSFKVFTRKAGLCISDTEAQFIFSLIDINRSGLVSFSELLQFVQTSLLSGDESREKAALLFNGFDKDKNGHISLSNLIEGFNDLHLSITKETISFVFSDFDVDRDGRLNIEEFTSFYKALAERKHI